METGRQMEVRIACPAGAIPRAGQYLLGSDLDNRETVLGTPIFAVQYIGEGFWGAPLFPIDWGPGTTLELAGPLGHGFDLPHNILRLGLVALGETISRLMPLVHQAAQTHTGMTLFTDLTLPVLPAALEVYPLSSLPDALDWPDFMVLDVPLEGLGGLRPVLHLPGWVSLPCPAQVLVTNPMPCAGMAGCGACAVPARKGGWKLACEDGPGFDLNELVW